MECTARPPAHISRFNSDPTFTQRAAVLLLERLSGLSTPTRQRPTECSILGLAWRGRQPARADGGHRRRSVAKTSARASSTKRRVQGTDALALPPALTRAGACLFGRLLCMAARAPLRRQRAGGCAAAHPARAAWLPLAPPGGRAWGGRQLVDPCPTAPPPTPSACSMGRPYWQQLDWRPSSPAMRHDARPPTRERVLYCLRPAPPPLQPLHTPSLYSESWLSPARPTPVMAKRPPYSRPQPITTRGTFQNPRRWRFASSPIGVSGTLAFAAIHPRTVVVWGCGFRRVPPPCAPPHRHQPPPPTSASVPPAAEPALPARSFHRAAPPAAIG